MEDGLVITEFDGFKDFIALYCQRQGVPEICIQDLETKQLKSISINDNCGEILPGLNQDYNPT